LNGVKAFVSKDVTQTPELDELIEFALRLARESAALVLKYYRRPIEVENKNAAMGKEGFDPVTAADRTVEQFIRREVERAYPQHGIVGEEYGTSREGARHQWIVDPIDGTRSFMMGLPTWGTLIGLTQDGKPIAGVMSQPFTGELFWGSSIGAFTSGPLGTLDLRARACPGLPFAVLGSTHPSLFKTKDELARFESVAGQVKMPRYGGDCYLYCLLAAGCVDLIVEASLKTFDVAALIPIIERAGGVITTWDGKCALNGGRILAAGDKRVHAEAMCVLNS
jgi:myo-inositol-1(or 4)-monophosphatase